jgi:hypothetical protein
MPRMPLLALALAVSVATAAARASGDTGAAPLLGMVQGAALELARIDPQTLQPVAGPRVVVGSGGCASRNGGEACWTVPPWTFSPDGTLLAVARNAGAGTPSLRIVDVAGMRVTDDVPVSGGVVGGLVWLRRARLLALQERCCSEAQRLLVVDLSSRRVVARRSLGGSVEQIGSTRDALVVLVAPAHSIGAARLAVVTPRGAVRVVRLKGVLAGTKLVSASPYRARVHRPGLALNPDGATAFVVDEATVAKIDLRSLAVSYHTFSRSPAAHVKVFDGPTRVARWVGGGIIAVSGIDGLGTSIRPFGLDLLDTRSWTAKTIDPGATGFVLTGESLLATGSSVGLSAYDLNGKKRFQLFDGQSAWVSQVYGGVAYVGIAGADAARRPLQAVDLTAGRVVGERADPLPWLVLATASGWWGSI